MKILHVVQGYTPAIGGTEFLIQKLSEHLVQQYDDQVTVFTTNAARNCNVFWAHNEPTLPPGIEKINGVTVRRFPIFNRFGRIRHILAKFSSWANFPFNDWSRAFFNGPIIFGMTREIASSDVNIIGASSFPFLHMHYALAGGEKSGTPVALYGALHTTDSWSFDRPMIYQAIEQADAYVAHSRFEQEYLIKRGISPAKITTIGAGIELEQFAGVDGRELRAEYQWEDEPVLAFVGHLAKRKGVHQLISVMPKVWERYPQVNLLLAGARTHYTDKLEQDLAELVPKDSNRIIIKSNFPEDDKAKIFSACDILVFPSKEESFGIVFLEAWACRKPVIGIRAGAIPSIVEEGTDGLLADPDNADDLANKICDLLSNPAKRIQMGEAGYNKVKTKYTWDIVTRKCRNVYRSIAP